MRKNKCDTVVCFYLSALLPVVHFLCKSAFKYYKETKTVPENGHDTIQNMHILLYIICFQSLVSVVYLSPTLSSG